MQLYMMSDDYTESGAMSRGKLWPSSQSSSTYGMRSVLDAREIHHTVNAGEGSTATTVAVRVKFLLGENVAAVLYEGKLG